MESYHHYSIPLLTIFSKLSTQIKLVNYHCQNNYIHQEVHNL